MVLAHACDPNTGDTERGGLQSQGQPRQHSEHQKEQK